MVKTMMGSASTVTEAVNKLMEQGYTTDLGARGTESHGDADHSHDPTTLAIEQVFRFEGDSDPGDETIVLGVLCEECDSRGIIVSAYGPDADPALLARLHQIT